MLIQKVKYYFFIFLFFSISSNSLASQSKSTLKQIDEHLTTAKSKLRTDSQKALELAQKAKKLNDNFSIDKSITADIIIAQVYQNSGNLDTALLILNEVMDLSKSIKNDTLIAEIYHAFGLNFQYKGSMEIAIENYHNALNINNSLGLVDKSILQLNNIGLIYREEENFDLAIKYLEKCLKLSVDNKLKEQEYFSYANIGYVLMKQDKWEEALIKLEKSYELSKQISDTLSFCTIGYLISDVKLNLKDYPNAKKSALEALEIAEYMSYSVGIVFSQRVLSEVYFHQKKYDEARAMIDKTLAYLKGNSANLYLEDVLNVSYQIEYETGDFEKALVIQNRLSSRRDSLNQIETKEKISKSEYKYQLLENEKENELLKIKTDSSKKYSFLAIAIAVLLLLVLFLSLYAYRNSKNQNKTLEQAIRERTQELENSNLELAKSNQELATSNEELERFAFIASHDLKTPLRDIISFTGLLERQLKSLENERVHEYLAFINKGGKRLNNLIEDTLEFSRLSQQAKESSTNTINLNQVIDELQQSLSDYLTKKNAKILKPNQLPSIKGNESSIILLFQNLIENSIKYNQSDQPTIKIYTSLSEDYLSIFIEDNGIGIPEEYLESIFVMFSRLHNKNDYEGSGLGLSICKKIVTQLNGKIQVKSTVDKGSVFEIKLPLDIIIVDDVRMRRAAT